MTEYVIRNRHRLRNKIIKNYSKIIDEYYSMETGLEGLHIDEARVNGLVILINDHEIIAMIIDDNPILTIKGLLKYRPNKRFVTVDMGAIKFITNGADIMAPGIIDADKDIQVGDIIWVRDENNFQPLAIGRALMAGQEMVDNTSSKAIESIHYVNDKLWNLKI